ncbi:serine hydrolase [Vulgatibacter sp.]|uniref:serine hydrolase n=1 Tax=Vulgatibacter sp. TaxID=1971226 RepID=UPI0035691E74
MRALAPFADYGKRLGTCAGLRRTEGDAHAAKYELRFAAGYAVPLAVSVDPAAPHRVVGLWLGNPVRTPGDLGAVVAELVRATEAGERRWDEVVRLAPEAYSLPSVLLQDWPAGAPVTLQTLATLMISRSDNTATDQLVHLLGRERIEAMLVATWNDPAANLDEGRFVGLVERALELLGKGGTATVEAQR